MTKDDKGIWLKVVLVLGALLPGFSLLMILVVGISNEGKDRLAKFVKEKGINYSIASAKD